MRAVVIGGGINGIMTSYFLSKKADVTLIEKNKELLSEASAINASLLMFTPNFNIYSFTPTYNNIYNSFMINPLWVFNIHSFNTHYRAVTPDGLPIIDRDNKLNNLYYNLGHGFFGWT
jgi:glycine/D-amino acid oxidase-like deaminating enzyme